MDPKLSFAEGWTAPRELTGESPRKTRLWKMGISTAIVATVFLVGAAVFLLWAGMQAAQQTARTAALRREGREAAGEVRRLWVSGRSLTPWVGYAFRANDLTFTGKSKVPKHLSRGFREASPLPVRFLPSSPAINHPAAWEDSALSDWAVLVVPVAPAALGFIFLMQLRGQRQLGAEGVPAAAVVTKCTRGIKGGWWVDYQFRTEDGRMAKGGGWPESRLEVGATICVLYLPQNPRLNQPYPMSYYYVAQ